VLSYRIFQYACFTLSHCTNSSHTKRDITGVDCVSPTCCKELFVNNVKFYGTQNRNRGLELSYLKHCDCQWKKWKNKCLVTDICFFIFFTGNHSVSGMIIRVLVPFLEVMIAVKDMKCASFPNLTLSTPMALMNVFPMFSSICLCLSKADIDSTLIKFSPYSIFVSYIFCICCTFLYICIKSIL
jgi:hypothetical protein